jgi:hypothetical protein
MRYLFGFLCVCALGVMPVVGCSEAEGGGDVFPCNEQGIRDAIAKGGGPRTFACEGPKTVTTLDEIIIDNDVILDGEGNLTVDGNGDHRVFSVPEGVSAELRWLTVTRGSASGGGVASEGTLTIRGCVISNNAAGSPSGATGRGGGILNARQMIIIDTTVTWNSVSHGTGGGIYNSGSATLTLVNSTVSDNHAGIDGSGAVGGGIRNVGEMTIINSTVSENGAIGFSNVSGGGISNGGTLTLTHSTVWGNTADSGDAIAVYVSSYTEIANTLIDGDCGSYDIWPLPGTPDIASNGYNIESPGDTCGFDQTGDQVSVTEEELNLGELADNGGPTMTHALGAGSVAIDKIPEADCVDADSEPLTADQRGEPRPETGGTMCDVGAFEVQP